MTDDDNTEVIEVSEVEFRDWCPPAILNELDRDHDEQEQT